MSVRKLLLYNAKAAIMGAGNRCYVPASKEVKKQDAGKIQCRNLLQAQPGRLDTRVVTACLLYTSPSPRDPKTSCMLSFALKKKQ